MDEYSRKRSAGGFGFSRRGSGLSFRESNNVDGSIQYCNRLGCSTRLNSMKSTQTGNAEKPKYVKSSSFRSMRSSSSSSSSSSKSIGGSSSKSISPSTDFRKPHQQQQRPNRSSARETIGSSNRSRQRAAEENDSSSQLDDSEGSEFSPTATEVESVMVTDSVVLESRVAQRLSAVSTESSGSRQRKQINRRIGSNSQDIPYSSSSVRRPVTSRSTCQVMKPTQYLGSGTQKYGLKNLSCSSISDVLPSGRSSDPTALNRKGSSVRKRPSDGGSSSSGGKNLSGSSSSGLQMNGSEMPQRSPRRSRHRPLSRDGAVSVRTRRAPGGETRIRSPAQQADNTISVSEPILYPQHSHTQLIIPEAVTESSSRTYPVVSSPIFHSSFSGRPNSGGRGGARSRFISSRLEDGRGHGSLVSRDGFRRFNMEGIAEVLLALERIEHDDELTYEQLLVLETNLFIGGFSFHDQHRDMRLDIDNMTYEELLALEEKMGTVSTALSEEALSKCLKRSCYMPACQLSGTTACGHDDTKCSVCQEEYVVGDEVGRLACDHCYHADCIEQWLKQKNWCPICKTSAASHEETKE